MKFLIAHENGTDRYTIYFDKGKGKMFYVSKLNYQDILKLQKTISKTINNEIKNRKNED